MQHANETRTNKYSQRMQQKLQETVNNKYVFQIRSRNTLGLATADLNQFKMFRRSCCIVFGLFFLLQLGNAGSKTPDKEDLLLLQLKVENLIEKIINYIQDYYYTVKEDVKCIPECVTASLMETLESSIDCVEKNENDFNAGRITGKTHSKNFLKCFTNAKMEIRDTMNSINTTLDYCPDDVTEKTYQINITTTFTKTFNINIKNGLEITEKEIELLKDEKHCFDHKTENDELEYEDDDYTEWIADGQSQEDFTEENFEGEVEVRRGIQSEEPNQEREAEKTGDEYDEHDPEEYDKDKSKMATRNQKA